MKAVALKVCGMKFRENISELSSIAPQYMGFIFYNRSPRYAAQELDPVQLKSLDPGIEKVGVFVNASVAEITSICEKYGIATVQLHGHESPAVCLELKNLGYKIIKAFSIDPDFDFAVVKPYSNICDFFLFDTKSENYGGTGKNFDWDILLQYDNSVPFFLSGGIDAANLERLQSMDEMNIYAIDVNSKFERAAGMKDIEKIKLFKERLTALCIK